MCASFEFELERTIDFFQWTDWVSHSVVTGSTALLRAKTIEQWLAIAQLCADIRSFNASYAIVVALAGSAVIRLKQSWMLVSKHALKRWQKQQHLFDLTRNFKHYRETLTSSPLPLVPILSLFVRDLFAIDEGNSTFIEGMVNVDKMRLLRKQFNDFSLYQNAPYTKIEISYDFKSAKLVPIAENTTWKLSHLAE
jgi:hypothetical protein